MGLCTSFLESVFFYNSLECDQIPPDHHQAYRHHVGQKPLITVPHIPGGEQWCQWTNGQQVNVDLWQR